MGAVTVAVVSGVQQLWPSSDRNAIILHCHVNTMAKECLKLVLVSPLTYVHCNGLLFQLQKPRNEVTWTHLLIGLCSQWPSRESKFWSRDCTKPGNLSTQHKPGWCKRTKVKQSRDSCKSGRRNVLSYTRPWDPIVNPLWKQKCYFSPCSNSIVCFSN